MERRRRTRRQRALRRIDSPRAHRRGRPDGESVHRRAARRVTSDRGRPNLPPRQARARDRPGPRRRRPAQRELGRPDEGWELLRPDLRSGVRVGGAAVRAVSSTALGDDGVFDAHHHLWDTRVLEYRLFRDVPELDRPFLLADFEHEARSLGVTGSLWVEAASAGADGARELEWVSGHLAGTEFVEGLVAYVALERAGSELDRVLDRPGPPVVGVRRSFESEDPDFPRRSEIVRGVRLVGERGLIVDLVLFPPALPGVLGLVDASLTRCSCSTTWASPRSCGGDGNPGRRSFASCRSAQPWRRSYPGLRPRPTVRPGHPAT